jgi:hypothetical protein
MEEKKWLRKKKMKKPRVSVQTKICVGAGSQLLYVRVPSRGNARGTPQRLRQTSLLGFIKALPAEGAAQSSGAARVRDITQYFSTAGPPCRWP